MPTAPYYNQDGRRLPSVTTIIGRFKDSGALIKWAYTQGREHENERHQTGSAPDSLHSVTSQAADIGTVVHAMVEAHCKLQSPEKVRADMTQDWPQDKLDKVQSGFQAYLSWESLTKLTVLYQEMHLISEQYGFGGTPDAIGMIGNNLVLLDWKTSNAVYSDMLIQLAAYRLLWEENYPEKPITGGFHLLRFAKDHGDFAHHHYPELHEAEKQFLLFREAYEIDKQLRKRAA